LCVDCHRHAHVTAVEASRLSGVLWGAASNHDGNHVTERESCKHKEVQVSALHKKVEVL